MRTTVTLDDNLFDDLMHFTHAKSRTMAVNLAIQDWIRRRKIEEIKKLCGKLDIDDNLAQLRQLEKQKLDKLGE